MLPRGLTSLLDSGKNKASSAAGPAAAAPSVQKTAAGWENTMAVKDGEASKLHSKTA